jgi:hypothetical protein
VAYFGGAPAIAVILRYGFSAGSGAVLRRAGAGFLAMVHIALAPLLQLGNESSIKKIADDTIVVADDLAKNFDAQGRARIVTASDPVIGLYAVATLRAVRQREPTCSAWLSGAKADVVVERTSARSFALSPRGRTFLEGAFESLLRPPSQPLAVGDERAICSAMVRVAALDGGLPSRIEVTADADLDDPAGAWMAWQDGALRTFAFPPVGESRVITWSPGPIGAF